MWSWVTLLAGLLAWAAHFFAVYAIGEFGGETLGWRLAVLALTLAGAGVVTALLLRQLRQDPPDGFERWQASVARAALLLSGIAILWQGLPALF